MARVTLTVDCADPDRIAEFWCAVLGYRMGGTIAQYRSIRPSDDPRYDFGARILFQKVPEPKSTKNRLHLDLDLDGDAELDEEVARLTALGATPLTVPPIREFGIAWVTMADPEGNEFCVVATPTTPTTP